MILQNCLVLLVLGCGMYWSVKAGKLTDTAALTGGLLGYALFLGAGFTGLALLAAFYLAGTAATSWKLKEKARLGLAEENKGRRTTGQVLANAGLAGVLALLGWCFPALAQPGQLMLAACFASATSDTLSSELGNVYGRRYYNILTGRPDQRGLHGVVSLEGTLLGLAGSCLIALGYGLGAGWNLGVVAVALAGFAGNLSDSVLGATLERRGQLGNNAVNLLNTCIAALVALLLYAAGMH